MAKRQYITHAQAIEQFSLCGEVWYKLDPEDGGMATVVSEGYGDSIEDVIPDRKYFVLKDKA